MKHLFKSLALGFVIASIFFQSCKKDEVQAAESIEGSWDIVEINSNYGEYAGGGWIPSDEVRDSGELGTFDFGSEAATYNFNRNDTLYTGSGQWDIRSEKVNEGFTRVPRFTLTIQDHFLFDVTFGDQTSNAEKKATKAVFTETPANGSGVQIELKLEKR